MQLEALAHLLADQLAWSNGDLLIGPHDKLNGLMSLAGVELSKLSNGSKRARLKEAVINSQPTVQLNLVKAVLRELPPNDDDPQQRQEAREKLTAWVRAQEGVIVPATGSQAVLQRPLRVFLCHCSADKPAVRDLYVKLTGLGAEVWFDEEHLLPGQDWEAEIKTAVSKSDLVIVCLSPRAVNKVGYVQREIRYALNFADEQPEGTIYIVPVKLQECNVPPRLQRWQWLNLYEAGGLDRLARTLDARVAELRRREEASSAT